MKYLKLLRVKHYIKNLLVFLPIFFNKSIFNYSIIIINTLGFIIFCFAASIIYIINDINDIKYDQKDKIKCQRPLANGSISIRTAIYILFLLLIFLIISLVFCENIKIDIIIIIYIGINLFYSIGKAKNIPILDLAILSSGYVLRVILGSVISDIPISNWLYLTIFAFALFFALCKRRNEMKNKSINEARAVLRFYNFNFLDKNMYTFLTIGIVFYSLWAINSNYKFLVWTVPIVSFLFLRYSIVVENNSSGDPIEVILNDVILLLMILLFIFSVFVSIYIL